MWVFPRLCTNRPHGCDNCYQTWTPAFRRSPSSSACELLEHRTRRTASYSRSSSLLRRPASYMIRTLRPANSHQTQLTHNLPESCRRNGQNGFTDPLFKVLFIFPSRYLFTIGLVTIFSFQWSLPPTLGWLINHPCGRYTGLSPSLTPDWAHQHKECWPHSRSQRSAWADPISFANSGTS